MSAKAINTTNITNTFIFHKMYVYFIYYTNDMYLLL